MKTHWAGLGLCAAAVAGVLTISAQETRQDSSEGPRKPAVDRTRDTIKMLDDIYKTAVVLITDKYVHSDQDFAAGSAAIALFEAIEKKGWHTAQLLDVSGQPYDDANVADDDFERQAVEKIKAGEPFIEAVEKNADGKYVMRAMTAIPVVLEKCALCHPHYSDVPAGEPIGAISYAVPIR